MGRSKSPNKTDFIHACPTTMNVDEIVEAAKAKGMVLTRTYVNHIRWRDGIQKPSFRKTMKNKVMTNDKKEMAQLLFKLGATYGEIARQIGVSQGSVYYVLNRVEREPQDILDGQVLQGYRSCVQDISAALLTVFGKRP